MHTYHHIRPLQLISMALTLLYCSLLSSEAQTLTGSAPSHVNVGQQFRLSYTVNTQDASDFRAGNIPEELEVLIGPNTSRQSSYQIVNGHATSSSSITYTYIVAATKNGTYTIPAAHVKVDDRTIASNTLTIKVSGSSASSSQQSRVQRDDDGAEMRDAGSRISASDLFIKVSANKKRVHEQEPVLLTYKVYTLVSLTQLRGDMPDLKSFYTQEVDLPQQKSFSIETVNGRPYKTTTWSQYVMFPQMTGKLQIPSITFEGIVLQQNRSIDPFEAFFNGGSGYIEVKKKIVAPSVEIQVDPLPERPAGFSGGVGRFTLTAKLDKHEVKANDPVSLHVEVSGTGNLKLIKQPIVEVPKDFDRYEPKVTDRTRLTANGIEGAMAYDMLIVPRHQGEFEIPPITFTYFNTSTNSYQTLTTEPLKLSVAKGSGTSAVSDFSSQEELQELNRDIRHIKLGTATHQSPDSYFFGSTAYWIAMLLLTLVFITLFIVFRQRAIENANLVKQRSNKANKVATRRLKQASRLMSRGETSAFYDEVLRALWGYVGDKLNIPVAQLSRENISQRLSERAVETVTISEFIAALDECEFQRYAPGDPKGNMNKVYEKAMTAIEQIEKTMKKRPSSAAGSARLLLILICIALPVVQTQAQSKASADSAYTAGHYQQAIRQYQQLLEQGPSVELYYNLGNAYYRTEDITRAVLNYERALRLAPGDRDVRFNLQIARSKTIDKIVPESEMFFVTWYRSLVSLQSVDGWARLSLLSLSLVIILLLVYLFASRVWLRKVGFFGGVALLVLFALSNLFAWQQRRDIVYHPAAIVTSAATTVKSTPTASGTDLFILHEGTRVVITDDAMRDWKGVRLADGKEGWIATKAIEKI